MQNGHSTNDGLRYESVKDYYSKVLHSSKDLKTSACTAGAVPFSKSNEKLRGSCIAHSPGEIYLIVRVIAGGRPHSRLRCLMNTIPKEVMDKFYGCGAPLPLGIDRLRVSTFSKQCSSHSSYEMVSSKHEDGPGGQSG